MSNSPSTFMELAWPKEAGHAGKPVAETVYQEAPDSTFTHAGNEYDINKVFKLVHKEPVQKFYVSDLDWMLKFGSPDPERVKQAQLDAPILVTSWEGRLAVIDGFHRLAKAKNENAKYLNGRMVSQEVLSHSLIED